MTKSLVDDILALERRAEELLSDARRQARELAAQTEHELACYRQELARDVQARLSALEARKQAEFEQAAAGVQSDLEARLAAVAELSPERIQRQVERILARFQGG